MNGAYSPPMQELGEYSRSRSSRDIVSQPNDMFLVPVTVDGQIIRSLSRFENEKQDALVFL
jgi:hypothetical protein